MGRSGEDPVYPLPYERSLALAASGRPRSSPCHYPRSRVRRVQNPQGIEATSKCMVIFLPRVPSGATVTDRMSTRRAIQHDPHRHEDPHRFWPERYSDDTTTASHYYLPEKKRSSDNPNSPSKAPTSPTPPNAITSPSAPAAASVRPHRLRPLSMTNHTR